MDNKMENVVEMGADILETVPEATVNGKNALITGLVIIAVTGGVAYGIYRLVKYRKKKKGMVEDVNLDLENLTE